MRRSRVMMAGLMPVVATMAAITSATTATTGPAQRHWNRRDRVRVIGGAVIRNSTAAVTDAYLVIPVAVPHQEEGVRVLGDRRVRQVEVGHC